MDIQSLYGISDAQLKLAEIERETQERKAARRASMQYGAQLIPTTVKSYKSEQQIGAKELKELEWDEGEKVFQTSAEHVDKPWYSTDKFFAKSRDMVEPTQGLLKEINRLEDLQKAGTITEPDLKLLTKYQSYKTPDPAVGMGEKMKNLFEGSKVGGTLTGMTGLAEMTLGGNYGRRSDAYKGATALQTGLGFGSLLMPGLSPWAMAMGLGKQFLK
tara:strand:+ start:3011 stop:3658 length:648 start_codon:yes stop_codon:yes gene_type:complete